MFEHEAATLERAAAQLESDRQRLLRADGSRLYSDAEHEQREAALLATFASVADAQLAALDKAVTEAERTLDALENPPDPLDTLPADALAKASAKAGFVREDADRLDLAPLADRLTRVAANGDAVDRALWLRYGQRRAEDLVATGAARGQPQAVRAVQDALRTLAATFADPRAQEKAAAARATLQGAREARQAMWKRQREADGSQAALMAEMRASGMYSL